VRYLSAAPYSECPFFRALAHGNPYQVLPLMNVTSQTDPNRWYNQVWL